MVEAASSTPPMTSGDDYRKAELDFLERSVAAEQGSVVVLHGRRGVGKARLAEELARHASAQPRTAVFEGHNPQAGARSFHPFAEIAHQAMVWAETAGATESLIDPLYP